MGRASHEQSGREYARAVERAREKSITTRMEMRDEYFEELYDRSDRSTKNTWWMR